MNHFWWKMHLSGVTNNSFNFNVMLCSGKNMLEFWNSKGMLCHFNMALKRLYLLQLFELICRASNPTNKVEYRNDCQIIPLSYITFNPFSYSIKPFPTSHKAARTYPLLISSKRFTSKWILETSPLSLSVTRNCFCLQSFPHHQQQPQSVSRKYICVNHQTDLFRLNQPSWDLLPSRSTQQCCQDTTRAGWPRKFRPRPRPRLARKLSQNHVNGWRQTFHLIPITKSAGKVAWPDANVGKHKSKQDKTMLPAKPLAETSCGNDRNRSP